MKTFEKIYTEENNNELISLGSIKNALVFSSKGKNGEIILYNEDGKPVTSHGGGDHGTMVEEKVETVHLDGKDGSLVLGGYNCFGSIVIKSKEENSSIVLSGNTNTINLSNSEGTQTVTIKANSGQITLFNSKGTEIISLDSSKGNLTLGGEKVSGDIKLRNAKDNETISLDSSQGNLTLGGVDVNGDISIKNSNDIETIKIDGAEGDILFRNSDFAEDFDISEDAINESSPGTVMILNEDGKLIPCCSDYDSKVVGVIAGAGNFKPGIIMDKNGEKNRLPVAIMGKVYCKVDANANSIQVGDMLTTSKMNGHAIKVMNKMDAFGSVIGKALSSLQSGTGLIPVLVNLK